MILRGAKIKRGETEIPVGITATPLQHPAAVAGLVLVSFHCEPVEEPSLPVQPELAQAPEAEMLRQLEDELKTTREELQSTIEELETSNEELKATHEEVMSMNEELQSSNEELETSKEELQSLNEELTTVNNQLQNKLEELETTNNDLFNLLSSSNIATLFLDPDLRIRRFTHATTRLMNLIPGDVGRPVADIARKYANDHLPEDCARVLEELRSVERQIRSDSGEWYIRRVQPFRTQDNRIEGTVVTFTDVTDIKRRDEEHERLASIVESSEDGIIGFDIAGAITTWNPAAERTYGYRANEILGQSLDRIFTDVCQTDVAHILGEVRAGRSVGPFETEGSPKNESGVQLSVIASPIRNSAGTVVAGSAIARDITERKKVESALREGIQLQDQLTRIAASVPGVICSYRLAPDGSTSMPYASPAIADLYGVAARDVADDFGPVQARIHPDDRGHLQETIEESARAMTPWRDTFRYRHPSKGEIWVEGHSLPSREADGSILWHGYLQDVTERKRAQQTLVEADRRKTEFLAMLGHELRNPLAPIRNAVEVLNRQDALPEKVRWATDLIGRQCHQLERLVNDLLDVSRINQGRIQLQRQPMRLQDALTDALESVAPLIEEARHTLETKLPEDPAVVLGDRVRLAQVFTNLLSNAAKYTPEGGHIRLSLEQEGPMAVIRVRDDGMGVLAEDLPGLFDLFSRGKREPSHAHVLDGLGVGLALARAMVEQHGGDLEGHSGGPGKGSEFVVRLPVPSEAGLYAASAASKANGAPSHRARRILVVDDNADVADSFRFLLEGMGHEVRTLDSGEQALAEIRDFQPDVVFLDIAMPHRDGYQVAAAIRGAGLDAAPWLVAVTGYGQEGDREKAEQAGFDRHLLKPPVPGEIEALLDELD